MSIRLLLPCPPALETAFAHYDWAVHGNGKFLYLLSIETIEQHGSELNEDESDDDVGENLTALPLPNHFSLVTTIPEGNNLESSHIPASDVSDDKLFDLLTGGG